MIVDSTDRAFGCLLDALQSLARARGADDRSVVREFEVVQALSLLFQATVALKELPVVGIRACEGCATRRHCAATSCRCSPAIRWSVDRVSGLLLFPCAVCNCPARIASGLAIKEELDQRLARIAMARQMDEWQDRISSPPLREEEKPGSLTGGDVP